VVVPEGNVACDGADGKDSSLLLLLLLLVVCVVTLAFVVYR
jgi:hypothetical protein